MPAAVGSPELAPKGRFRIFVGIWLVFLVVGLPAAAIAQARANAHDSCPTTTGTAATNVAVTGLPSKMNAAFSYGRGTRRLTAPLTVSVPNGPLPRAVDVAAVVPTNDAGVAIRGLTATATQIDGTSSYTLSVCVDAHGAAAGAYTGELFFPGSTASNGADIPVTVTVQSRLVPYMLFVGGPILLFLGLLYATAVVSRRANPTIGLVELWRTCLSELLSVNGVIAFIAGAGAVFTAWEAQCFRNATWGTPWPGFFVTCVTLAGAAGGAATVPIGLASKPARGTQVNDPNEQNS